MAGYIGTTPVPQATQHRESFTATGGQTSFATVGYTPQFIDVYLNGVKLAPADFTATNGSDVVLASGATASDILEIVAYTPFEVANQTFTGTTTAANLTVTGAFTSQGIDDNADAVAITINSSENVGIGTSSPKTQLELLGEASTYDFNAGTDPLANLAIINDNANSGTGPSIVLGSIYSGSATVANARIFAERQSTGATNAGATDLVFEVGQASGSALAERMRITSSGSVGIGTSSPDAPLVVEESAVSQTAQGNDFAVFKRNDHGYLKIYSGNTKIGGIAFGDPDDPFIGAIRYQHSTDHLDFYVNNAERMRIDSDGNLLVGKTSDNQALAGVKLGTGGSNMSRNNEVLVLNRLSTDGTILNLKKDGATVGSIGTQSGTLQIDGTSGSTGLLFGASNIYPRDNGANSDGGVDIGGSSIRFKDLYLSGGVYLGGTGSANKLTDYEHGFFTPTFGGTTTDPSGVTYDGTVGNEGFYVKVGRAVFIQINIRTDGITNVGDGTLLIKGLPFTSPDQTSQGGVATVAVSQSRDFAGENPSAAYITENATYITPFYRLTADGGSNLSQCSDLGTGLNDNLIRIGGTYYVTV